MAGVALEGMKGSLSRARIRHQQTNPIDTETMKAQSSTFLKFVIFVLAVLICGCDATEQIAESFKDSDGDGWIDDANNVATVLTLESVSFSAAGSYRICVDEVRFPLDPTLTTIDRLINATASTTIPFGVAVAKRVYGRNIISPVAQASMSYTTSVQVLRSAPIGPWEDLGTVRFRFTSGDTAPVTITLGGGGLPSASLTFSATHTRFSDPDPASDADLDGDGIRESEEFLLASRFGGIGDPRPSMVDLVLIVGHTEPALALDPYTREQLKSRFFQRAINLHIDDGTLNGFTGAGGAMQVSGGTVVPGTAINLTQLPAIRTANIAADRRRFAYFALLAAGVSPGGFGVANRIPGNQLVMRSIIAPLTPNVLNYQSGVLMHELGHLLGLCHPTQHDGTTCAAIPTAERDPGGSVMGAPSESTGITGPAQSVVNALRRPLDYSPAQWALIRPGAGLAP